MPVTPLGGEVQVNTNTAGDQTAPQVIALSDGRYDVVWKTSTGWALQLYGTDGAPVGTEVSFTGAMPQAFVAMPDGRLGTFYDTHYAGILNADGSSSVATHTIFAPAQIDPSLPIHLVARSDGLVVAVVSNATASHALLFDPADGKFSSRVYTLGDDGGLTETDPHVTAISEDDLLVSWRLASGTVQRGYLSPAPGGVIYVQSAVVDVASFPAQPDAYVVTSDGSLTVASVSNDNGQNVIHAGWYDNTGILTDADVASSTATPTGLSIFELTDHRVLMTWFVGGGSSTTIMGAVLDGSSTSGAPFVIATDAATTPNLAIANLPDGHIVVTWQSASIDGHGTGIALRTFDPGTVTPQHIDASDQADLSAGGVGADSIAGGGGEDTLAGAAGDDTIDGGGGSDTLSGGAGDDSLLGGSGADWIVGGSGNDTIIGGDGEDTVYFIHERASYHITFDGSAYTIIDRAAIDGEGTDQVSGVEHFVFNRTSFADTALSSTGFVALNDDNTTDPVIETPNHYIIDEKAAGNALSNDVDSDLLDGVSITGIRTGSELAGGEFATVGSGATKAVAGTYGYFEISSDGSWHYTLSESWPATELLTDGETGHDVFTYQVADGQGQTDTAQIDIAVEGRNDYPELDYVVNHKISTDENSNPVLTTIHGTDRDSATLTYVVSGGDDAAGFVINPLTGQLRFATAPDYESPQDANHDNVYNVEVGITDGTTVTSTALQITVKDLPDTPHVPDVSPVDSVEGLEYTAPSTIRVFFAEGDVGIEALGDASAGGPFTTVAWTDSEIAAVKAVYASFEAVAEIHIQYVADISQADFVMAKSADASTLVDGAYGYWDVGDTTIDYGGANHTVAGMGVFDTDSDVDGTAGGPGDYWSDESLQPGGYAFAVLLHQIGHGLGLAHPYDNGGGSTVMPGVIAPNYVGDDELNQGVYTVMSYNDGWPFQPGVGDMWIPAADTFGYGWQSTPMALDVAALQLKYTGNVDYHAGDDVYVLPDTNGPGTRFAAIWDTGGTDTIRYDGNKRVYIDLRPATLDYSETGGGPVSYASGVRGGFTIANNVSIEKAIGGSGDDWFISGDVANTIDGGAGEDTIDYSSRDRPVWIYGDKANVYTGADTYKVDTLVGIEDFIGGTGNDVIHGTDADNVLIGYLGKDTLDGGSGTDTVDYSYRSDPIFISLQYASFEGVADFSVQAQANPTGLEKDSLSNIENAIGGSGNDYLQGNGADNDLRGLAGNDVFCGSNDHDTLDGGDGFDIVDYALIFPSSGVKVTLDGSHNGHAGMGDGETVTLLSIEMVIGTTRRDSMVGGSSEDYFQGLGNQDTIDGGGGFDVVYFSDATARISVHLNGSHFSQVMLPAIDRKDALLRNVEGIVGGSNSDKLVGDSKSNFFEGLSGRDTIDGGGGSHDTADYTDVGRYRVAVTLSGSSSVKVYVGGYAEDTIRNIEDINSASGSDKLIGDSHANEFHSFSGNDALTGNSGNDTLAGGYGNDTLSGGSGADRFVFDDLLSAAKNIDTIRDFSEHAHDRIVLYGYVMDALGDPGHLAYAAFYAHAGATHGHDLDDRIIYNTSNGKLYYDANGSTAGGVTQIAVLSNHAHLSASDFVVV